MSLRSIIVPLAGLLAALVACRPSAAPPPLATPTAPAASSGAQVSTALTSVPRPSASPAEGAPVSAAPKRFASPPAMAIDPARQYSATIDTTLGTMNAQLFASEVPITVNNFVFLARQGYYDGVPFHRVIQGFMVQTGDPTGTGRGGPGYTFKDEPVSRKYDRGTLAMANSGPNTNGSQFFIVHQDTPLQPNYTIFGKLTDGFETLDAIASSPTGPGKGGENTPKTEITISSIQIHEQ